MAFRYVSAYNGLWVIGMLMNAEQAGKALGKNPSLLRKWAKDGKVPGVFKVGAIWVASFEGWQTAAKEVRKPGRKSRPASSPE